MPKYDAETALESAEHYRLLTEKLPFPMLIHVAGILKYLNTECVRLLGGESAEEFINTSILDVIHPDYQPVAMQRVQRILQGEENVESVELKLIRKDGSETWIETTGIAIPFAGDQAIYVVGKNIADRKHAEAVLLENRKMLQMTLRYAPDAVFICDQNGRINYVNENAATLLGYSLEELCTLTVFDLSPTEWREAYRQGAKQITSSNERHVMEIRLLHKEGHKIPLELNAALLPNGQIYGSCRDISERKHMEKELRIAATAFETQEGILVTNANGIIIKVNQAFTRITGYRSEEVLGHTPALLKSGQQSPAFYQAMWECLNREHFWEGEIINRRKDGTQYPERLGITAITNKANIITNYVATFTDISRQKKAEAEILNLAYYDPLTQLPNRRLLFDRLHHSMAASSRHNQHGAVIFIDLDYFKILNDTKGHEMGDLMLIEVAERLQHCVRELDTVSRLGGDEFVVMLETLSIDIAEASSQAEHIAQKIRSALSVPYILHDQEFHSTPSMGVALFQGHNESIADLIKHADIAMYQAKATGRNAVRFYDVAMQTKLEARMDMEGDLRKALNLNQFSLHYQIQVDSRHDIIGVEALLRWNHPERGGIPPTIFIPLAEETGLILQIGEWVLQTACSQIKAWSNLPYTRKLQVAVNVSSVQFSQDNFVAQIERVINSSGIDPGCLKLELTESMMLENIESIISKMYQLKQLGVGFSMDDFGTGFSSLSYLKRLPLDQLKIDQSFVRDLVADHNDKAIVQAIITMGEAFGLNIIAEGVETEAQRAQLTHNGCYNFQGYLFGKPMPIEQLNAILQEEKTYRERS